ncbi:MAG TPA: YggS family pyridoxal phosphate-dependent enzyme [Bryobacteraceae bacterium]|nr:YggS family pyridoxal phosphate-dependent enzyme [Bryobacteraceae bacterium]
MSATGSNLQSRIQVVEQRLAAALQKTGRRRSDIQLVAVTKKFSSTVIQEAYQAGLREFGENYVQEFAAKRPAIGDLPAARYHLIGHLQSNKARIAVALFDVIQTVDSPKLLERLNDVAGEQGKELELLLEIKLSDEASKTGARPEDIPAVLESAANRRNVRVSGLMTMPPWSENAELSRPYFHQLASLAHRYSLPELSMGMSNDFEVAIEEGATIVRVGTALFGARPKPAPAGQ